VCSWRRVLIGGPVIDMLVCTFMKGRRPSLLVDHTPRRLAHGQTFDAPTNKAQGMNVAPAQQSDCSHASCLYAARATSCCASTPAPHLAFKRRLETLVSLAKAGSYHYLRCSLHSAWLLLCLFQEIHGQGSF